MDTFAALSETHVRKPFASTLKVKAKVRPFIHETEDIVVFSPQQYKKRIKFLRETLTGTE